MSAQHSVNYLLAVACCHSSRATPRIVHALGEPNAPVDTHNRCLTHCIIGCRGLFRPAGQPVRFAVVFRFQPYPSFRRRFARSARPSSYLSSHSSINPCFRWKLRSTHEPVGLRPIMSRTLPRAITEKLTNNNQGHNHLSIELFVVDQIIVGRAFTMPTFLISSTHPSIYWSVKFLDCSPSVFLREMRTQTRE